jgi:threonine dehydrogenase-like Zn-dependent dehydrogenase
MKACFGVRKKKMCSLTNADLVVVNLRDVILKITSAAICGSDCIFYSGLMPTMEKGDVLS